MILLAGAFRGEQAKTTNLAQNLLRGEAQAVTRQSPGGAFGAFSSQSALHPPLRSGAGFPSPRPTRRDAASSLGYIARMLLTVNGEPFDAPAGITVRGLVERLGLDQGPVAVERNREVVPRAEHAATELAENDVLEIVHFVGGG